jgi:hypothetical protein
MHDMLSLGAEALESNQTLHCQMDIKELKSVLTGIDRVVTFICPPWDRYAAWSGR